MSRIRVLVVDDSALVRSILRGVIESQPDMECVGAATDPVMAREMIRNLNPDVLTLDIEMPRMDGLEFLEKVMRLRPMPVVMISSLTERGAEVTLRALEMGAVDFVSKPKLDLQSGLRDMANQIAERIRGAAKARVGRKAPSAQSTVTAVKTAVTAFRGTERIVAIGASTGGTEAIRHVLQELPTDFPGVVITQHMPAGFTKSFAQRLNQVCALNVKEAGHQERVLPGTVYIAPGGRHLTIKRDGANYQMILDDGPPVNRHKPSVEALFQSVAKTAGPNALGVMLTGMGGDGATGMAAMRKAGAWTIAQDEATCVVFGMPREAIQAGGVEETLPLGRIAQAMLGKVRAGGKVLNRV